MARMMNLAGLNKHITTIIFDLGEVIIDLDLAKTVSQFKPYLTDQRTNFFSFKGQRAFFDDFEIGKINPDQFVEAIQSALSKPMEKAQIINTWNAMLLGIKPAILALLQKLKQNYNLLVLSNTNVIHIEHIYGKHPSFSSYFHHIYLSHEIGKRKPNKDAYEYVLQHAQRRASECLFIDDRIENVEAAKQLNIHAVQKTKAETLEVLLKQNEII